MRSRAGARGGQGQELDRSWSGVGQEQSMSSRSPVGAVGQEGNSSSLFKHLDSDFRFLFRGLQMTSVPSQSVMKFFPINNFAGRAALNGISWLPNSDLKHIIMSHFPANKTQVVNNASSSNFFIFSFLFQCFHFFILFLAPCRSFLFP